MGADTGNEDICGTIALTFSQVMYLKYLNNFLKMVWDGYMDIYYVTLQQCIR